MNVMWLMLLIALNILPAGTDTFTVETDGQGVTKWVKQEDGGWKAQGRSGFKMGTWYLKDERTVLVKNGGYKQEDTFTKELPAESKVDWSTAGKLLIGGIELNIDQKKTPVEVSFDIPSKKQKRTIVTKITWAKPKKSNGSPNKEIQATR